MATLEDIMHYSYAMGTTVLSALGVIPCFWLRTSRACFRPLMLSVSVCLLGCSSPPL